MLGVRSQNILIQRILLNFVVLSILTAINGCTVFSNYEDVSNNNEFSSIVGRAYETKKKLLIHGVNMDSPIGKKIHGYSVTPHPGMGGREIINREELTIGSTILLNKVLRCTNCYLDFGVRHSYVIDVLSSNKYRNHEVRMREYFGGIDLVFKLDDKYILNPEYFRAASE